MEIKKSYELRQFGNKVVLIGFTLSPSFGYQECKMKVLVEADELVEKEHVLSPNDFFFVLRVGEEFVLCRDVGGYIYISWPCKDYKLLYPDVLFFYQNIWYRWTPEQHGNNEQIGNYVWDDFHNMFVLNQNHPEVPFVLHYYEDGKHKKMACKEFDPLVDELHGINDKYIGATHYDVMKIIDEKGETLWLSIKQELIISPLVARKPEYHFIFSQKPQIATK